MIRLTIALSGSLLILSCSSAFKNEESSDTFVKDSGFLNQGYKVEEYEKDKPRPEAKELKNVKIKETVQVKKEDKTKEKKAEADNVKPEVIVSKPVEPKVKRKKSLPFKVGEEVTLSATYLGVEAGRILIGVDNFKKLNGEKLYHFYAFGKTSSLFSMFYKVQNKIESLWDPVSQKPRSLAFDVVETKQKYKTRVYFDWNRKKGDYREEGWHKKKGDYKVEKKWTLEDSAQDIVSAVFKARTFPLTVGEEYKVTVMEEDKVIDVYLRVDRAEVLRTRVGKFNTLVLKPRFSTNGKFKQVGDISVWLTNDDYKQVVRIESKIKIGSIVAKLHSIKRP